MTFTTTFTLCFSTSRRLERSERSHGLGGSSTRTSSGSLRTSSSTSKMKEKKKEEEEEEIGTESPRSEEKLKDEEVSEVRDVEEEESVEKLVTNGDADGEEPRTAETADESEEVRQEVRHPHSAITMVTANLLSVKHRPLTSEAKGSAPAGVMWSGFDPWRSPALMSSDGPG